MKTAKFQPRFYRQWLTAKGLFKTGVRVKETDLMILSDKPIDRDFCAERISFYRSQIENYIAKDPRFSSSLKPLAVELKAAPIIKKMAVAARLAGVGPMAAVAGALAECLGRDLLRRGAKDIIIENGGDIFLKISRPCKAAIYSGRSKLWSGLGIEIMPQKKAMGVCASSATIGHSLSFGQAESVVILAKDAFLADAAATATCNRTQGKNSLGQALGFARSIKGVFGAVVIFKNNLACFGKGFRLAK
ncbi:MAG: UPF0280 family protein [Candidatus Omnitrophota bacterium]